MYIYICIYIPWLWIYLQHSMYDMKNWIYWDYILIYWDSLGHKWDINGIYHLLGLSMKNPWMISYWILAFVSHILLEPIDYP